MNENKFQKGSQTDYRVWDRIGNRKKKKRMNEKKRKKNHGRTIESGRDL